MSAPSGRTVLLHYLIILIAALLITAPIYFLGIPNGNDLPQHYQFAQTIESSLAEGVLYPSWSANSNHGFGDIGIRFYPPLSYYVLAAAKWIGGNWYNASVIAFAFWFFIGGIGIYLLTREWFSDRSSLAAALLFLFIPYHTNQIFNAFFYAEFAATAILPFCFLYVTRICKRGHGADVIGLAIAYAVLILTHLPLTVIGSISLFVYSLASLRREAIVSSLIKLGGAVSIALVASSFYWIRMVTELSFVKIAYTELTEKAYDFRINFLLSYLTTPTSDYLERSLLFSDLMLAASLLVAAAGCIPFLIYGNDRRRLVPLFALLACALFFATPLSLPIWERADFLARVQFPWRWLAIISIGASVIAASGFEQVISFFGTSKRPFAIIISGVAAAVFAFSVAQVIRPAVYVSRYQFEQRIEDLRTARNCECLWPVTAQTDALNSRDPKVSDGRQATLISESAHQREYYVLAGEPGILRLPIFYYPHWKSYLDGLPAETTMDSTGAITVQLPKGAVDLRLAFEEPFPFGIATVISMACWFGLLIYFIARMRYTRRVQPA